MKPPEVRRLLREDFKDAPNWIDRLIVPINLFQEQTFTVLNSNVAIGDNVQGNWFPISFTTRSDYNTGGFDLITVPWSYSTNVKGVFVGQCGEVSSQYAKQTQPVFVSWYQATNTNITINYITGLQPSTKYQVMLLLL